MKILRNPIVLLLLAGVMYLGSGWIFFRRGWSAMQPTAVSKSGPAKKHVSLLTVGPRPWDFWSAQVDEMITELGRERQQLDSRAHDLDTLQTRLDGEKAELDRLKQEITRASQELDRAAAETTEAETRNLRPLAQTYSRLTARAAVAIFRELDDATALKILALMKTDAVSVIFEEMAKTPDRSGTLASRAAGLTEKLRLLRSTPGTVTPTTPTQP